jgi:hypothetical protein
MPTYAIGQSLGNGATVVADIVTTLADGTIVEEMHDSKGNVEITTTPSPGTPASNVAVIQQRAQQALLANATYLAIPNPTAGQNVAQVQALTKECNGLIRLLLGILDSTSGT